ncbi:hypothetical protein AALB53_08480 [Lachnospiraceae bacterium 47-T17]
MSNFFHTAVVSLVIAVLGSVLVSAFKSKDFLTWCCSTLGAIDCALVVFAAMFYWCSLVPPVIELGTILEYEFISDFEETVNDYGVPVRAYKSLDTGRYKCLPVSATQVTNDDPVMLVTYQVNEYYGTKEFYYKKVSNQKQYVFE